MEDPPFPTHPSDHSNRRLFTAGGSSSGGPAYVDADVIEIPPPLTWKPKRLKHHSTVHPEVIVVDDEDPDDVVIIDEKFAPKSKGKKSMHNYLATKGTSSTDATIIGDDFSGMDLTDVSYDDDCVMLQAHFDNFDVPTGVEAAVPWWPGSFGNQSSSSSLFVPPPYKPDFEVPKTDKYEIWKSHEAPRVKHYGSKSGFYNSKPDSSGVLIKSSFPVYPTGVIPPVFHWAAPQLNNNLPALVSPVNFNPSQDEYLGNWGYASHSSANPVMGHVTNTITHNPFFSEFVPPDRSISLLDDISAQISPPSTSGQQADAENSILKRLETFKKFDTLEDHSDHLFFKTTKESVKQSKTWSKTIAEEWRMLEKDLPDTIFVRVFETRMDLLRAVILGADGTPYHDGLFFFDVNFTSAYPKSPPHVKYHAHGLRINPNLYHCGKVCLSLLGTWGGRGIENWRPGKSNMLQVLVSIQGLILNTEPYYNEPGYANSMNSQQGKTASKSYSENTFLLSLKTMLYTMRNPPKDFEDLVFGHFYQRAHDILESCRAYLAGVEVGSFEKGKSSAGKTTVGTCSPTLKGSLPTYINSLVQAFTKIGVKDCEKYLVSPDNIMNPPLGEGSQTGGRTRKR